MKYTVHAVRNGYILKIADYGLSIFKEPYEKGIYVFHSFDDMNKFLKKLIEELDNGR